MKTAVKTIQPTNQVIDLKNINVVSNTRSTFDEKDIKELAESIKTNGLLQSIGVLKTDKNSFRIIFGERRYRAHLLIKAQSIACKVYEGLTEQQITEIQIIENLQRKDIHPIEEAKAFYSMIEIHTYKEVALKVGKSPSFVAQRLKLNDLIEVFQTAFRADRFGISVALEVAILSKESQQELWDDECEHLDEDDNIEFSAHDLNRFKLNLNNASFNIKDKTLIPSAGACTNCPFNTACQKELFPEEAKTANCTNSACFQDKTKISFEKLIKEALAEPGTELLSTSYNGLSDFAKELTEQGHHILGNSEFEEYDQSEAPNLEDYRERLNDEEFETEAEMLEEFKADLKAYNAELEHYNNLKEAGKIKKGFVVCGREKGQHIDFILVDKNSDSNNQSHIKPTAKHLQEKIKAHTVTADDYSAEINRLYSAETRKKELDEEKTTPLFYEALREDVFFAKRPDAFEKEELCTMILLMKETGGFWRNELIEGMFDEDKDDLAQFNELLGKDMVELNKIYLRLCRCVMLIKLKPHDSARPSKHFKAQALLQIGNTYVGTKINEIWSNQMVDRQKRETQLATKVKSLEAKIQDCKPSEAA